jgi:guanylate kinase
MARDGLILVISGPSGAGKGTLYKLLEGKNPNIRFSVSATTRKPREGEEEGKSYFFKSAEEFRKMIDNNELIEWDCYCDNYYGTPVKFVEDTVHSGFDIVLDITVEGAVNIKERYPESVLIFILPPSFDELKRRITGRGTESADVVQKRLETAKSEIEYVDRYDYIVINNDAEIATEDIIEILKAEKHKFIRNTDILTQLGMYDRRLTT